VDCLVIDSPPVLLVSDALVLAPYADGVILAARLNSITRDEAQRVRTVLDRAELESLEPWQVAQKK